MHGAWRQDPALSGLSKPHFFILEISVVGFTPRSSDAPSGPLIFQLALVRAAKRLSRSRRCSSASVKISDSCAPSAAVVGLVVGRGRGGGWAAMGRSKSRLP